MATPCRGCTEVGCHVWRVSLRCDMGRFDCYGNGRSSGTVRAVRRSVRSQKRQLIRTYSTMRYADHKPGWEAASRIPPDTAHGSPEARHRA